MLDRSDQFPSLLTRPFRPAIALAGTPALERGTRAALDWAAGGVVPIVQLDASVPDCRPRSLDASARRDLAASIRRRGLACCGLDLWIPSRHFADPTQQDRAVAALVAAIELAADLADRAGTGAPGVVSAHIGGSGARGELMQHAQDHGVLLADHAWPMVDRIADGPADIGVDPAGVLMGGGDPASALLAAGQRLASGRLSDCGSEGRLAIGDGRLDTLAMLAALDAASFAGALVIDLRGTGDADAALASALAALRS